MTAVTTTTKITPFQAKYLAHELTLKRAADDAEKLTTALVDARVDLNPHQVDAALFAFKSPLAKGAILADEVGLGKTIEAGLVITQKWAENKRRVLIICPSSLRGQWRDELADKFFLPAEVIDTKSFMSAQRSGVTNPLDRGSRSFSGADTTESAPAVLVCSFHFAASRDDFLLSTPWDLVVVDEAHRLRNVYKPTNKIGRKIRSALVNVPKILLTATPLQNSLMELYGLVSFIDEHAFGDSKTFSARYSRTTSQDSYDDLKRRLAPLCHRTLRRQVAEYVKYTNRIPLTQEFLPSTDEQVLYELVSEYLRRPGLYALPSSQRALITLVMRKLLASSSFAIAGGLTSMSNRLSALLSSVEASLGRPDDVQVIDLFGEDLDSLGSVADEWEASASGVSGQSDDRPTATLTTKSAPAFTAEEVERLRSECDEVAALRDQALSIRTNSKGDALLSALRAAFTQASGFGAAEKAIIFTESRLTQDYLERLLTEHGYGADLVLFNGSNNGARATEIYNEWLQQHKGSDRVTGTRAADVRSALVDYFKDAGRIMIATEAAAEGVNLQFCSIVVNYDLPWNPQRIEQRIGRCHRYGQLHDVVVVNFLNRNNAADQRVFELLDEKFRLFSGVFGASDEVLGAIESGVDIERRIVAIYEQCRLPAEIDAQFAVLQQELDEQISEVMADTRRKLLENFDAEVHDRLKVNRDSSLASIGRAEAALWALTEHVLQKQAEFDRENRTFVLKPGASIGSPSPGSQVAPSASERGDGPSIIDLRQFDGIRLQLGSATDDHAQKYRISHPIAEQVIKLAKSADTPATHLRFDHSGWDAHAAALEPFVGRAGWMTVQHMRIDGTDAEEHLLIAAHTDDRTVLDPAAARRLLEVPAEVVALAVELPADEELLGRVQTQQREVLANLDSRQAHWFDQENEKLERWAEDSRHAMRSELKQLDADLKDLKSRARAAGALPEKLELQQQIKRLDAARDAAWRTFDDNARIVEKRKDELLDAAAERLQHTTEVTTLFTVRWELT